MKIKTFLTLTFLISSIFTPKLTFPQTLNLIHNKSPFNYYCASDEPDTNWYMPDYDDSSWILDTGDIGYGYNNLDVQIDEGTSSLYLRYKFNVDSIDDFKKVNLFADFDDGYIAYINGKEVLRVNINDTVENPAHNDVTERSHEQESTSYPVLGYFFDSTILDSTLVEGDNIIAVHVLNDTIGGSDLYYELFLYNVTYIGYNLWAYRSRYKRKCKVDSSKFPLVVIETDEFGIPWKKIRTRAFMGIIDNGPGNYNYPSDSFNVYEGDISIEVRGQSSGEFPKRSYRFETIGPADKDSNVVLLNMPVENDWILFGPFHDKAQFRNKMVMDLGARLGSYQPRSRFCELIYNGECHGLYRLSETIKRDQNRVNISKLTQDELSWPEVTGGFILRFDKQEPGENYLQIVYPKKDKIKQQQIDYITSYLQEYESVLFSDNFMDPENGFRKYVCDSSLVDYMIMTELTKNADGYLFSTYFYKDSEDKDNRFKMGPLWDLDLAFGNTLFQEGNLTYNWQFEYNTILNITRFLQDVSFVQLFQDRWYELRQGLLHTDSLFAYIDSLVSYIEEPRKRNYYIWPVIDEYLFFPNYVSQSYDEEIQNIKNWLYERLEWIDDNIDDIYYPVVIYNSLPEFSDSSYPKFNIFPNPFSDRLCLTIFNKQPAFLSIELVNLLGQVTIIIHGELVAGYSEIKLDNHAIHNLANGIYIMGIFLDNKLVARQKIVKE